MKSIVVRNIHAIALVIAMLAGCSGGSDDGGGGTSYGLDSTWRGNFNSASEGLVKLAVLIQDNRVTQVEIDGANTGLSGSINKVNDNIFGFLLSDDTEGGFYVDGSKNHMVILTDDLGFGVIEKNGSLTATFGATDIQGTWSGYSVDVDNSLDIVDTYNSSATVQGDNSFSGMDKTGNFSGSFVDFNNTAVYSQMSGNFTSDSGANGPVTAFISPDKSFVGTAACDQFIALDQCTFSAWRKQ
jgi:hypothetical protein